MFGGPNTLSFHQNNIEFSSSNVSPHPQKKSHIHRKKHLEFLVVKPIEPRKNLCDIPLYWLVNGDPHNGLL